MIQFLKKGRDPSAKATDALSVRQAVEAVLADVEARGDAAVRDYSATLESHRPRASG